MMKALVTLSLSFFFAFSVTAEQRITRSEYIGLWKDEAIYQMAVHGIPASITLAQGILESADGNSELAKKANNHFGIKCHSDWTGKTVRYDDDRRNECFRKYPDARESYEDHSIFLGKNRYASLFELKITDYKGWARGLKKCGYATNPKYAKLLIDLIEKHDLTQYDDLGKKMIRSGDIPERATHQKRRKKNKEGSITAKPDSDDIFDDIDIRDSRAMRMSDNNVPYIIAGEGDTYSQIAKDLGMMPWQIKKYNELQSGQELKKGERVYTKPKRARSKTDWHTLKAGESMWSVAHQYGVKLHSLYKKNQLAPGSQPEPGTKLSLRKQIK